VETGNIKLNFQKIAPHDVILFALESVKFHAERKRVTVEVEEAENLPHIRADKDKTTWVLVNLLTNAIRYSPENERVILRCEADGDSVVFSVNDFGPGIESKYVGRLFEKFFQVPGTPSGTGLGLAISKEFIEAQGGTIEVKSEPGRGSMFRFKIVSFN
jgi:signal transduction histidine kinase